MAEEGEGAAEISIEDAVKTIESKGGKAFLNGHSLEEHIQNSELYKTAKDGVGNAMGAAYKKSGDTLAKMVGVEVSEGDRFEDIVKKAEAKIAEFKKDETNPEFETLKTQNKEDREKLEAAMGNLKVYQEKEFESSKDVFFKEALGDKKLDIPEGVDDKFVSSYLNTFRNELLEKAEFTQVDGKTYMKVGENTYSGDSIKSKLTDMINESGYKFKEKQIVPPGSIPNLSGDQLASLDIKKRGEMAKEKSNKDGHAFLSKEYFQTQKEFGLPLPQLAVDKWPELK